MRTIALSGHTACLRISFASEADIIREAIRLYLDGQEDLIGSRRHFQRSFRDRIDGLEASLAFQLNVVLFLLTADEDVLREAIIIARKHGILYWLKSKRFLM